jgi:hypothetical protein
MFSFFHAILLRALDQCQQTLRECTLQTQCYQAPIRNAFFSRSLMNGRPWSVESISDARLKLISYTPERRKKDIV